MVECDKLLKQIEEKNARLNEALSILSDRELEIISRRYGLNNHLWKHSERLLRA